MEFSSQSVNPSGKCKDQMHWTLGPQPWGWAHGPHGPMGPHISFYRARTVTGRSHDGVASQLLWMPMNDQYSWLMGLGNTCYAAWTVTTVATVLRQWLTTVLMGLCYTCYGCQRVTNVHGSWASAALATVLGQWLMAALFMIESYLICSKNVLQFY